jgi:hypothetical protein
MSVKTLNAVQVFSAPVLPSNRITYSIAPALAFLPDQSLDAEPAELESFLENENPLGCIRGVLWVMAFNATVFLLGFTVWASFKFLW